MSISSLFHATLVEYKKQGLLLKGPSGYGKSDLALRLIGKGGKLVADDQVQVFESESGTYGQAPASLQGLLEVRGLGILSFPYHDTWKIDFIIILQDHPTYDRLPLPQRQTIFDYSLACFHLYAFEASILNKIDLIVESINSLE